MDPLEDPSCSDFLDYSLFADADNIVSPSLGPLWLPNDFRDGGADTGVSAGRVESEETDCLRKRVRDEPCTGPTSKACRERLRRGRLNDRFLDLSHALEPDRPAKTNKPAILDDAIRVLNQLKTEAEELKQTNEKLREEVECLKAEKNDLRKEKTILKEDKERIEQQLKSIAIPPPGLIPGHPAAYHAAPGKMAVFPGYGLIPMWPYLPPSVCDTSQDHELRPPAA
ncbi:transcription factor bHLH104-like [Cucurbita pepo subsp. pepo]|uniref:transcription factor bHLH104-like n=1 Tax=Cucurbita pepo subsp. pepo TaxID=3664 RepID=UPI000C9D8409|nr:transcription factor bHLH104-like [Cucurbita pepo subsp. pepo]